MFAAFSERVNESSPLLLPTSGTPRPQQKGDLVARPTGLDWLFRLWEYEFFMLGVVLLNAVSIGYQIDYPEALAIYQWFALNLAFWIVFCIEVIAKIFCYGYRNYFHDKWNIFDFVITAACGVEIFCTYAVTLHLDHTAPYSVWKQYVSGDLVEILRLFRLFRMARLWRQLGVLAESFLQSLQALGWIAAGAMLWFYICACGCTVFLGRKQFLDAEGDEDIQQVRERFSSVGSSLFALFEIMTLEGWTDYARPLLHRKPLWVVFFIVFIFVAAFFLLNLVTAVVVDRTVAAQEEANKREEASGKETRVEAVETTVQKMRDLNDGQDHVLRSKLQTWVDQNHFEGQHSMFIDSMAVLLDHNDDGTISLSHLEDLWKSYEGPMSTETMIRFHINQARRMEYQERLTVTVLHVLERMSGESLRLDDDIFAKSESFLTRTGTSPVRKTRTSE